MTSPRKSLFLISTTHELLLLDLEADQFYRVDTGRGIYYGICHSQDAVYAVCRHGVRGPDDDSARAREAGGLLRFDSCLRFQEELQPEFPMRDVHGMALIDDQLWITCSYDNLVAIYDLRTKTWRQWYPAADLTARGRDINHFNTIAMLDGRLCLVAHNFGQSHLLFYTYPELHLDSSIALGVQAHDVFNIDRQLATCSSAEGSLISIDGSRIRTGGFPRGVCMTEDAILLGVSMRAERSRRHAVSSVLRCYGPDWRFQSDYVLEGAGMVLAIERLPDCGALRLPSYAHATKCQGCYNDLEPGNVYSPGRSDAGLVLSEWHGAEGESRWTAARNARIEVLRNPGEDRLTVEAINSYPGPFVGEIRLNGSHLGVMAFPEPGVRRQTFPFAAPPCLPAELTFQVPRLWRPSDVFHDNEDERLLGISVRSVMVAPPGAP